MTRQHPDRQDLKKLRDAVGGVANAGRLIQAALGCSKSKSQKIAGGRYVSKISVTEQMALAKVFKKHLDDLPPLARKRAS